MSKIIPMASFEPLRGKLSITINYKTTHKGAEIETAMFEYSSEGIVGERTAYSIEQIVKEAIRALDSTWEVEE